MIDLARSFALKAHGIQRYGQHPYIYHLDQVVALLDAHGYAEDLQVVGYLHDTLEDTRTTQEGLERLFGPWVADCVELISDPPGETRQLRKLKLHARLAQVTQGELLPALIVKVADRLANVAACQTTGWVDLGHRYRAEQALFREAVYRPGLCDSLWETLEGLLADPNWRNCK